MTQNWTISSCLVTFKTCQGCLRRQTTSCPTPFLFDLKDCSANEKRIVDHILEAKPESGIFDLCLDHELVLKSGSGTNNKITFPNIRALLTDPNVFIADSGVTTHRTPTNLGMTNLCKAGVRDSNKIASGTHEGCITKR